MPVSRKSESNTDVLARNRAFKAAPTDVYQSSSPNNNRGSENDDSQAHSASQAGDIGIAVRAKLFSQGAATESEPPQASIFVRLKEFFASAEKESATRPEPEEASASPALDPVTTSSRDTLKPAGIASEIEQSATESAEEEDATSSAETDSTDEQDQTNYETESDGVSADESDLSLMAEEDGLLRVEETLVAETEKTGAEIANSAPAVDEISDQTAKEDSEFSYDTSNHFSDIDAGDSLAYAVHGPTWLTIDFKTGELSGTPTDADVGNVVVTVIATDQAGEEASTTFSLRVADDPSERVVVTGTRYGIALASQAI